MESKEMYEMMFSGMQKEIQYAGSGIIGSPFVQNAANVRSISASPDVSRYSPNVMTALGNNSSVAAVPGGAGGSSAAVAAFSHNAPNVGAQVVQMLHQAQQHTPQEQPPASPINKLVAAHNELQEKVQQLSQLFGDIQQFLMATQSLQNFYPSQEDSKLMQQRAIIISQLLAHFKCYGDCHDLIFEVLKSWRRSQALAGNGAPHTESLDDIQRCFEVLELYISNLLCTLRSVEMLNEVTLKKLTDDVLTAQTQLIISAFIVEKQPPQVMKTNTRFSAAVRWLIGPHLGLQNNPPSVECLILSESQAFRFVTQRRWDQVGTPATNIPTSGEILSNVTQMEYISDKRTFSANFRNMQLKKIKRAEKKGTECVMDEKFALLFYTKANLNDYQIRAWTLSLPVVVIVHGNQEPQSWATITWDNAFAEIMREPFVVTDRVAWSQLAVALNIKFSSATGRPLTQENMSFLYEKLVNKDINNDRSEMLSWSQFCKEPLPDRNFTFWDWFFAIMKLTKDHLLGIWKAGLAVGFINKQVAQEQLAQNQPGSFLLRFSDSELGGISVGFFSDDHQVFMLQPWTARDLNIRNLADRIHDIEMLRFLISGDRRNGCIDRDKAFSEFYTQRSDPPRGDGYVPSEIKVRVPASEFGNLTPHHGMTTPLTPRTPQNANEAMQIGSFSLDDTEFNSMQFC